MSEEESDQPFHVVADREDRLTYLLRDREDGETECIARMTPDQTYVWAVRFYQAHEDISRQ